MSAVDPLTAPNPATTNWIPLGSGSGIPQPVVNGQFVKGVGGAAVWSAIAPADVGLPKITAQSLATGPPASPADGDIWIATAVDANGTVWHFRYNAGSASAFKWEFVGGSMLYSEVGATEGTASSTYAALTTAGPSITVARAGDYFVTIGAHHWNGNNTGSSYMSYDIGATGAVDADSINTFTPPTITQAGQSNDGSRTRLKTGLAASTALVSKYKAGATGGGGTATFLSRWMSVVPVRIS